MTDKRFPQMINQPYDVEISQSLFKASAAAGAQWLDGILKSSTIFVSAFRLTKHNVKKFYAMPTEDVPNDIWTFWDT